LRRKFLLLVDKLFFSFVVKDSLSGKRGGFGAL